MRFPHGLLTPASRRHVTAFLSTPGAPLGQSVAGHRSKLERRRDQRLEIAAGAPPTPVNVSRRVVLSRSRISTNSDSRPTTLGSETGSQVAGLRPLVLPSSVARGCNALVAESNFLRAESRSAARSWTSRWSASAKLPIVCGYGKPFRVHAHPHNPAAPGRSSGCRS